MKSLREYLPLLAALVGGTLVALAVNLSILSRPSDFGPDLLAFLHASQRLLAGSPLYPPAAVNGPISVFVLDAYLYPPTLAFLLVPFVLLFGSGTAALVIWAIASLVAFSASLILGLRSAAGTLRAPGQALPARPVQVPWRSLN